MAPCRKLCHVEFKTKVLDYTYDLNVQTLRRQNILVLKKKHVAETNGVNKK